MLVASLVFSTVLVAIAYSLARRSGKFGGACGTAAAAMFFGLPCTFFPALALCGFLMLGVGLVCRLTGRGPGLFLKGSLAALVGSHLLIGVFSYRDIREHERLRAKYPSESLAERLAYEKRPSAAAQVLPASPVIPPGSSVDRDLHTVEDRVDFELYLKSSARNFNLRLLHQHTVSDFINSPGFGVTRSIRPRTAYIELPEVGAIPFPSPGSNPEQSGSLDETSRPGLASSPGEVPVRVPPGDALRKMHRDGVMDFVNPEGFGYIEDREHVIGFQAHQFRTIPQLPDGEADNRRWRVASVELISILKHSEPVAYRSEHLPRMDELRDAPTRPLNTFEQQALAELRRGQDIEIGTTPDRIRLLGSIRAVKHCLSCHEVERGELLGAFSYTLFRESARP